VPRRHIKKDDRTTLCGLTMGPKFQKNLAPDRQSVTCGACELVSRPQVAPAPKPVEKMEWAPGEGEEGMGDEMEMAEGAPRPRREAVPGAPTQMRSRPQD
jgi:hypothetical protein